MSTDHPTPIPHSGPIAYSEDATRDLGALCDVVCEARSKFNIYLSLFAHSEERVALINDSAPEFFIHIQNALPDSVVMQLCKLLDPARMGQHENLSAQRLLEYVDDGLVSEPISRIRPPEPEHDECVIQRLVHSRTDDVRGELQRLLDVSTNAAERLRTQRNRRICHLDRVEYYGRNQSLGYSVQNILDTFDALGNFLEAFSLFYDNCHRTMDGEDGDRVTKRLLADLRGAQELRDSTE